MFFHANSQIHTNFKVSKIYIDINKYIVSTLVMKKIVCKYDVVSESEMFRGIV